MATITTRSGKGSPLTNNEVDANFNNLNTDKAELSGATFTGQIVAPSLDISGDIDVDGTTNLDVVDIDGAVDMASTLAVGGVVTANAGVTSSGTGTFGALTVDTMTLNASSITGTSNLTLDIAGDINLDADGGDIVFKDGGTEFGSIGNASGSMFIEGLPSTGKVGLTFFGSYIEPRDNGSSSDGAVDLGETGARFRDIHLSGSIKNTSDITLDAAGDIILDSDNGAFRFKDAGTTLATFTSDSGSMVLYNATADKDLIFKGNDGGSTITALTLDMSAAGAATFNSSVTIPSDIIHAGDTDTKLQFNAADSFRVITGDEERIKANNGEVVVNDNSADMDFRVESNNNANMLFVDGGNNRVGVNTGSPAATFTVKGTANTYAGGFQVEGTDETSAFAIAHIDGATFISGNATNDHLKIAADGSLSTPTLGTSNVRFGVNAGNSIVSGSTYNVVVGDEAGTAITTGDANVAIGFSALSTEDAHGFNTAVGHETLKVLNAGTDSYNTAVGFRAGLAVTTGIYNTLIGGLAGLSLTDADENTAIGLGALQSDTKGSKSVAVGRLTLGSQNFTNATDTYNTGLGYHAGKSVTTGVNNTLIGGLAGDAITTASYSVAVGQGAATNTTTSSQGFTAVGADSLFTNTTGTDNVAVGRASMYYNTTGGNNVAVGRSALQANTTASNNTAVGKDALTANTTGSLNVGVGTLALTANTTGVQNVAVGVEALDTNSTGGSNTAIGYASLYANTTASNNTAVGHNSLKANTTGTENTALGANALDANTTGSYNVALGSYSLTADTLGARNVAIGRSALQAQNFTSATDSYNTGVGYAAGASVTTGVQNTFIGGLAGDATDDGTNNVAVGFEALSANCGSGNVALGCRAGKVTTADNNTFVGLNAGTATTSGSENTAVGQGALDANTTASGNTAVGSDALTANTTGYSNTGIGKNALEANTTGNNNASVGYNGLVANTTGGQNASLGTYSLASNTTGSSNVAMGYNSLGANTTASNNTTVGFRGLQENTTGERNVGLGFQALYSNTTASNNTAVGHNALFNNTTGTGNVALGKSAGENVTTGDNNTLIGKLAGDAITTGSANVAVGEDALSANTTAANNTAVGQGAGEVLTTGDRNVAVGALALDATDDGIGNTAVGYSALSANCGDTNTAIGFETLVVCTGAHNTAVGRDAGGSVTSGINNLFLGFQSGLTGSPGGNQTTGSNQIALGDENITSAHVQVDWIVASDARDKTDFTALDLGLDFVKDLQPVTYKWDKRSKYGDKTADDYDLTAQTPDGTHKEDWLDIGFKAQEVEALEIAAGYNKSSKTNLISSHTGDGKQMGLQYSKFVPILVKAIQEQQALIESLTARIETLEG